MALQVKWHILKQGWKENQCVLNLMFATYHDVVLVVESVKQQGWENLQNRSRVDFGACAVRVSVSSMVFLLKVLIPHCSRCSGVSTACRELATKAPRLGENGRLKLHSDFDPDSRPVIFFFLNNLFIVFICLSLRIPNSFCLDKR